MVSFDKGPPAALANHFAELPDIPEEFLPLFWNDWGPVFYRGRLTGKARCWPSPPTRGPTERVVGRTLVGDAGQRVQGFLAKLGLTRSYVLVNAFPVAVHPRRRLRGQAAAGRRRPAALAQPLLRPRHRARARGDRRLRRQRQGRARAVEDQARRADVRGPPPLQPQRRPAREVAYGDPGPARGRHPRPGRRRQRPELRHHLQGVRLRSRSRRRTCPSACRPGWVTTPGDGATSPGTTTRSSATATELTRLAGADASGPRPLLSRSGRLPREAAGERRVLVEPEAGDRRVARRLVERDRLGLPHPGLEHHHLGPGSARAVSSRWASMARARPRRRAPAGRRTSA